MTKSIYIADTNNNRIIERSIPDLAFVAKIISYVKPGPIVVSLNAPTGICTDGTYVYIAVDDGISG